MKSFFTSSTRLFATIVIFVSFLYLAVPSPAFPQPPPDSVQSLEEANVETPLRRAYFTNYTRQQVVEHYQNQLAQSGFLGKYLLMYHLNHPPEDAQVLIRDQTQSTFLEEIGYPLRESMYINGYEPLIPVPQIHYQGVLYRQEIKIRYVPSSSLLRVLIGVLALASLYLIGREISSTASNISKQCYRRR